MIDDIATFVERILKSATLVDSLSISAVWALMFGYQAWRNYRIEERVSSDSELRTTMRIKEAETNFLMAKALEKLSDSIERIDVILDERLPRRNTHV